MGPAIGRLFVGLGENFTEASLLKYGNDNLTEQFNSGIRSLELDVRYRKNDFEVVHVPLVDNRSHATNFKLALDEICLWSDHNPSHIPLMIILELKNDWMMLDPALSDFSSNELIQLDSLINEKFGSKLLSPKDIIGNFSTLNEAVTTNGWPLVKDTLGKVIFILHPGKYTEDYVNLDPTFKNMAMFPAASNTDISNSYASFIVHNKVNITAIQQLVNSNYIVRTRIDEKLVPEPSILQNALISGAQILSTEFVPNHNFKKVDYVAYLQDQYTIVKNGYLLG